MLELIFWFFTRTIFNVNWINRTIIWSWWSSIRRNCLMKFYRRPMRMHPSIRVRHWSIQNSANVHSKERRKCEQKKNDRLYCASGMSFCSSSSPPPGVRRPPRPIPAVNVCIRPICNLRSFISSLGCIKEGGCWWVHWLTSTHSPSLLPFPSSSSPSHTPDEEEEEVYRWMDHDAHFTQSQSILFWCRSCPFFRDQSNATPPYRFRVNLIIN